MQRGGRATARQQDEQEYAPTTGSSIYMPWQTLQALASETGQAVRQTFSDSGINTSGYVQQGVQIHASPQHYKRQDHSHKPQTLLSTGQEKAAQWNVKGVPTPASHALDSVQAEISRVQRKMLSTDAATEVVLRFNYLSGGESKVHSTSCCR